VTGVWIALGAEAFALACGLALAADLRAHTAIERVGGINAWGYRGPVMREKTTDEIRIAVAGGDLAFGWGVAASETLAPTIRQWVDLELDRPGRPRVNVTAVNLGALGLPPRDYASRVAHFASLRPDVICVMADPALPSETRAWLPPADSAIVAATGYTPALPLALTDKGKAAGSRAIERTGEWLRADAFAYRLVFARSSAPAPRYAAALEAAVRAALAITPRVVLIAPPYRGDDTDAHSALLAMFDAAFASDRRVRLVDLGDVPELADPAYRLDGINFSTAGHLIASQAVTPAVLDVIGPR
jgi:hypothetical protein